MLRGVTLIEALIMVAMILIVLAIVVPGCLKLLQ